MRKVLGDNPDLPALADPDGAVASAYGIDVVPTCVFVDSGGHIAKVYSGTTTAAELAEVVSTLQ